MVRPIVRDVLFLGRKSEPAEKSDLAIAKDLQDTLQAHRRTCIGMAANMIGFRKNIIAVAMGTGCLILINPVITDRSGPYETEESCLSLDGARRTRRYQNITVCYRDVSWKRQEQKFSGVLAQAVQHEYDHLSGVLI